MNWTYKTLRKSYTDIKKYKFHQATINDIMADYEKQGKDANEAYDAIVDYINHYRKEENPPFVDKILNFITDSGPLIILIILIICLVTMILMINAVVLFLW